MSVHGRRQVLRGSLVAATATLSAGVLGLFRPRGLHAAGTPSVRQSNTGAPSAGSLDTLLVEREIHRLMSLYSRACDERRWDLADQIFAPNVESSFNPGKGRQGIVDSWKQHLGGCGPTQHLMGN